MRALRQWNREITELQQGEEQRSVTPRRTNVAENVIHGKDALRRGSQIGAATIATEQ